MKTNLKDNIWIEGFSESDAELRLNDLVLLLPGTLYAGQTSDIPEDVAIECVKNWRTDGLYNNYKIESQYEEYLFKTAKESIQSACNAEYCIIYKQ